MMRTLMRLTFYTLGFIVFVNAVGVAFFIFTGQPVNALELNREMLNAAAIVILSGVAAVTGVAIYERWRSR